MRPYFNIREYIPVQSLKPSEYILMVPFVLELEFFSFQTKLPIGVTTQMKALDEYILC